MHGSCTRAPLAACGDRDRDKDPSYQEGTVEEVISVHIYGV
jgi:hypothetical protein